MISEYFIISISPIWNIYLNQEYIKKNYKYPQN